MRLLKSGFFRLAVTGIICASTAVVSAAINDYALGSSTGTYNTANSASTSFFPAPPDGTARARIGTGGGSFSMVNPGNAGLGTGSEIQGIAPTGTSVNKFSIYNYTTNLSFHNRFKVLFTGGSSGIWYFFQGTGPGYSDNTSFASAQVFTGLRWTFGASGTITTNIRVGTNWVTTGLPATPFAQDTVYDVEIYGNNSGSAMNYRRAGTTYSVANNLWDLWVNGTRTAGLQKAGLADFTSVNSFMFNGESSTGNVATIILDDFQYGGDLATVPVTFAGFSVE